MKKHYLKAVGLCLSLCENYTFAGILAEKTRVIYPEGKREISIKLNNTNDYPIMTQLWVDHGVGDPDTAKAPFLVLAPMFQLKSSETKGIRIILTNQPQATDRESLYWLNMYEIPAVAAQKLDENHVNISMNTQIKLIYRPNVLKAPIWQDINKQLTFSLDNSTSDLKLIISNPTAHYISMGYLNMIAQGTEQAYGKPENLMIAPMQSQSFKMPSSTIESIEYSLIDDEGFHLPFKHSF